MTWRERVRRLLPYVVTAIAGFALAYGLMFMAFRPSVIPQTASVPDVLGSTYETARQRLETAGFEAQMGTIRVDPTVIKGAVADQSPKAGAALERGGKVVLTTSAGPPTVNPAEVDSARR